MGARLVRTMDVRVAPGRASAKQSGLKHMADADTRCSCAWPARQIPSQDCYIISMTVRQIRKRIEADGWYHAATKGSHHQYKHPVKTGKVTLPGRDSDDLHPKTVRSILKQAGLWPST